MQFQVSMLRLWANNIETFADNCKSGVEEIIAIHPEAIRPA
jgi:hypothetical protein